MSTQLLGICLSSLISNPVKPELLLVLVWWFLGTLPSSAWQSQPDGTGSQGWPEKALISQVITGLLKNSLFPPHFWQEKRQQQLNITKKAELEKKRTQKGTGSYPGHLESVAPWATLLTSLAPWATILTSLRLSFFNCKIRVVTAPDRG